MPTCLFHKVVYFSQVKCMLMTKDKSTLITGDSDNDSLTGGSVIAWDMSSGERKFTLKADGPVRRPLSSLPSLRHPFTSSHRSRMRV